MSNLVDWIGKHWFKIRHTLMAFWVASNVGRWIVESMFLHSIWQLSMNIVQIISNVFITFLLLENFILRIQIRKQDAGKREENKEG